MILTFCGANREVTGSCYHLETSGGRLVVDCGMFQGGKMAEDRNADPFPFEAAGVDAVVVTHAHFDHIGRLPKMFKEGFRGALFGTRPTIELAMINLRDAVHLIADEARRHGKDPLYNQEHVDGLEHHWKQLPYHQPVQILPGVTAYAADAGHILGSASLRIEADGSSVVFSGDLGNSPVPLLRSSECLLGAETVIIESTYGTRTHESGLERTGFLRDAINRAAERRGTVMIPAFAFERTQELLYELHQLQAERQIPRVPIFLDSPLAIAATEVFRQSAEYFNATALDGMRRMGDLFSFPGLRYTLSSEESKHILHERGAKVIIAGSGMMNGGRILHHLANYLERPETQLLIIGYQVEGSLGRQLHDGAQEVRIYGKPVTVKAEVRSCGAFSGHADAPRLKEWLHCFGSRPPKNVYVTHGEALTATAFAASVTEEIGYAASVPEYASSRTLG